MLLKMAWRNLWRNRRRTGITVAAIALAVLTAVFMQSIQEGVYDNMIRNVVGFHTGYAQIHQQGYWDDPVLDNAFPSDPQLAENSAAHPAVARVVPRLENFALASAGEISKPALVIGVNPEAEDAMTGLSEKVVEGDYLDSDDTGALVAEGLARKLGIAVGDTLILLGQGYRGASASGLYPVQGLLRYGADDLNDRFVYLTLSSAQLLYAADGLLSAYAIQLEDPIETPRIVRTLRTELDTAQYEVMSWQEMMPDLVQTIESDQAGNVVTIFILYLIISFGIFGTVLMMTTERSYEFGVLTAVGMQRWKLALMLFLETLMISLLGVIVGAALAIPLVLYFQANPIQLGENLAEAYREFGFEPIIPAIFRWSIFLDQAIVIFCFSVLISLYPIAKAFRLKPVKAMRG